MFSGDWGFNWQWSLSIYGSQMEHRIFNCYPGQQAPVLSPTIYDLP